MRLLKLTYEFIQFKILPAIMKKSRIKARFIQCLILIILTSSCNNSKSINENGIIWSKTKYDLWISQKGELAILSFDVSDENNKKEVFIDHFSNGKSLNSIIDTTTFKYLGNYFYKDKNHVYRHYNMSDGGHFIIEDADSKSFELLGDCYAKDNTSIYGQTHGKLDMVDYKTFKFSDEFGCYAKDKNDYYFWGEKIDTTNADDDLKKVISDLDEL